MADDNAFSSDRCELIHNLVQAFLLDHGLYSDPAVLVERSDGRGFDPRRQFAALFQNCLRAVKRCDAFLGIIRGQYGSGKTSRTRSITHRELLKAIELNKRRWVFVNHDVVVARRLLKQFRYDGQGRKKRLNFKPITYLDDIRVIEMYEDAMRVKIPFKRRAGNWVQDYRSAADLLRQIPVTLSS